MQHVYLEPQEWTQVMGVLSEAPWRIANPLLMKIGEQLRVQQEPASVDAANAPRPHRPDRPAGNSKEQHE
jgi:hypothetical protein